MLLTILFVVAIIAGVFLIVAGVQKAKSEKKGIYAEKCPYHNISDEESVVGYEKIDCRKKQTLSLQKTTYNELFGGGVGNPDQKTYGWQPSRPGGLAENLIREICSK